MLLHIQCKTRQAGGSAKKSEEKTRAGQLGSVGGREEEHARMCVCTCCVSASPSGEVRIQKKSQKERERMLARKDKEEKKR